MANWCDNNVVFSGDATRVERTKTFFKDIQEKQNCDERHWLPPFVIDMELNDEKINYSSRWIPNNEALVLIAEAFGVSFVNRYDELSMGIFGEATYSNGLYNDTRLNPQDFQSYHFDKDTGLYVYEEKNYSFEWPIFEKMLEQRKSSALNFKTTSNISREDLVELYGEILPGDLVLKFAEHKNFDKARETFLEMNESTIFQIGNYLEREPWNNRERYKTHDKFLAMSFLHQLIREWNTQRHDNQIKNGLGF